MRRNCEVIVDINTEKELVQAARDMDWEFYRPFSQRVIGNYWDEDFEYDFWYKIHVEGYSGWE